MFTYSSYIVQLNIVLQRQCSVDGGDPFRRRKFTILSELGEGGPPTQLSVMPSTLASRVFRIIKTRFIKVVFSG